MDLDNKTLRQMADIAKILSSPVRLRILLYMLSLDTDAEFVKILGLFYLEQATISHHMRLFRQMKVLRMYSKGNFSFYAFYNDEVRNCVVACIDTLKSLHKVL